MKKCRKNQAVVEGPMGLRMFEDIARDIEQFSKGLPKDFTYRRMAKAPAKFNLDVGSRSDISTITTDAKDRDGEVVLPMGGDWTDYNNVVMFAHQYDQLPVGSCKWMKASPDGVIACTQYATKPEDWGDTPWLPSAILHLMQQPVPTCTGKSIGFLPLSMRPATSDEISKRPEMKSCPVIDKWVGIEFSVAPVPANQTAEMLVVSKCLAAGDYDEATAEIVRKAMATYAPRVKAAPPSPRRTIIVVPGPNPDRRKSMSATMPPPAPMANPAAYQHLSFMPPKDVMQAHKDGVARHDDGETKGHATPEMMAMAKHLAMGGESSPGFCRKCKDFHDAAPNHVAAKPGTPAFALAQLHGGAAGKAFYGGMCKSMDLADAAPGPGPATALDENGGSPPPAAAPMPTTKKDMGGSEGISGDGGDSVMTETMPACKACQTNARVMRSKDADDKPATGEDGNPKFECKMCGKSWSEPAMIDPNGSLDKPAQSLTPAGSGQDLPGDKTTVKAMSESDEDALAVRIVELQMPAIVEKAMEELQDRLILAVGGV